MTTSKPLVYFDIDSVIGFVTVGVGAFVIPMNHESELVSNRGHVFTSDVVEVTEDKDVLNFETLHTLYVGVKAGEE